MPLAIHGVVFRKDGSRVDIVVGEDEDDMSFCISDILPHMAQEQMKKSAGEFIEGEDLDLVVGLNRNDEDKDAGRKAIMDILHRQYGICEDDFLSAELESSRSCLQAGHAVWASTRRWSWPTDRMTGCAHTPRCRRSSTSTRISRPPHAPSSSTRRRSDPSA